MEMEGWDSLRQSENEDLAKNQTKQADLDMQFTRCFATESGQAVLAHLRHLTLDQPSWYPGEDPSHGYAREGQNSIIREILRRIERGRTL